jgi:hypothetical protein
MYAQHRRDNRDEHFFWSMFLLHPLGQDLRLG